MAAFRVRLGGRVDYGDCWPGIPWADRGRNEVIHHRERDITLWGM